MLLQYDSSSINVLIKEEGGNSSFRFSVYNSPVDRCSPAILWQQSGVNVKRSHTWHCPNYFGKHTESHHNLQIGLIRCQSLYKVRVFHFYGLKYRNTVLYCILFHRRRLQMVLMSSNGFVGLGHYGYNIVSSFNKPF